jgi:hypothetical protein
MRHDHRDHLQGNKIVEVGDYERGDYFRSSVPRDLPYSKHRPNIRVGLEIPRQPPNKLRRKAVADLR